MFGPIGMPELLIIFVICPHRVWPPQTTRPRKVSRQEPRRVQACQQRPPQLRSKKRSGSRTPTPKPVRAAKPAATPDKNDKKTKKGRFPTFQPGLGYVFGSSQAGAAGAGVSSSGQDRPR